MNNEIIANYIQIGLLIITFASIISPVFVTLLNNIHDGRIRKIDINNKIKQNILKEFAENINYLNGYTNIGLDYYRSLNLLNIYFDVDNELIEHISSTQYKNNVDFQKDVTKLMKKLSKQIKYK